MKTIEEARSLLQSEEFMHIAAVLGGGEDLAEAYRNRLLCAIDSFVQLYGSSREIAIFSAPGRTELGGNHTDHQHGHVLAASINLDVIAVVARREDTTIRVHSEGFPEDEISLEELEPVTDKKPTAAELIRGIAARFKQYGCPLETGFDAYTTSQVMAGSGLSSSAAFEVLLGNICNALYAENRFTPVELAQMGQYAENVYFQKPCGLMDQMASSVGGAVAIDFANPMLPAVHPVAFDFSRTGYVLCIVDTGGNHARTFWRKFRRHRCCVPFRNCGKPSVTVQCFVRCTFIGRTDGHRANLMHWIGAISRRSCTWCRTPDSLPIACCKTSTRPPHRKTSPSPLPLQSARQCWAAGERSVYTAAVSAEQYRHLCRLCCCPSFRRVWNPFWERAAATCCEFVPLAA